MKSSVEQIILGRFMELAIANDDLIMEVLIAIAEGEGTPNVDEFAEDLKKARQSGKNFIGNEKFKTYKAGLYVE